MLISFSSSQSLDCSSLLELSKASQTNSCFPASMKIAQVTRFCGAYCLVGKSSQSMRCFKCPRVAQRTAPHPGRWDLKMEVHLHVLVELLELLKCKDTFIECIS